MIATAATACTTDAGNATLSGTADRNKLLSVNNHSRSEYFSETNAITSTTATEMPDVNHTILLASRVDGLTAIVILKTTLFAIFGIIACTNLQAFSLVDTMPV